MGEVRARAHLAHPRSEELRVVAALAQRHEQRLHLHPVLVAGAATLVGLGLLRRLREAREHLRAGDQ
eukprot:6360191-Prymnesium_polylepis.1